MLLKFQNILGLNQDIIQHAFIIKDESMTTSQKLLEKLQSELSAVLQEKEALEKLQKKQQIKKSIINNWLIIINLKRKNDWRGSSDANEILEEAQNKADAILKELQGQIKPHQVIQAKKQLGDLKHQKKQVENHENHDYKIGDIVKVLSVNRQGEVVDINKKECWRSQWVV